MAMVISRKYEVIGQLGQGGMGVVYKVRHTALDTILALKVLPRDLMEKPEMVARFYREARVVARLNHPNIVRVSDIDHDETLDFHYFVMEYIQGQTFAQALRERGPLPLQEVLTVTRQVANALAYAHNYTPPVIHRDIKPANIMLEDRTGRVVVMDFGIAKELDSSDLTKSGMVLGTLKYCAPEQIRHEPLDGSADLYSLGMVMYEAYTGQQFFAGLDEAAVIGKVLFNSQEHEPVFTRPAPPAFVTLVTKAMAKSRERRYQRVEDFLRDLEACGVLPEDLERTVLSVPLREEKSRAEQTRDEVEELEEQIRRLEDERQRRLVISVQAQAQEARERAARAGAGRWATEIFQQGLTWEETGHVHYRDQQYPQAQETYHKAEQLFAQAEEEATAAALLHNAEQARQEMTTVKAEAERYGAREKARTFYGRGLALQARADELWEHQTYQKAEQIYAEARSLFADARDLAYRETFKEEAGIAQAQARAAREEAEREEAAEFSAEIFQAALRSEQQAAVALNSDEFFQARELYNTARQQYTLAQQQARAERQRRYAPAAEKTRQVLEDTRLRAEQTRGGKQVTVAFAEAQQLAEHGRRSEERGEYGEAQEYYERARQEYERILSETEQAQRERQEKAAEARAQMLPVPQVAQNEEAGESVPVVFPTTQPDLPRSFVSFRVLLLAGTALLVMIGTVYLAGSFRSSSAPVATASHSAPASIPASPPTPQLQPPSGVSPGEEAPPLSRETVSSPPAPAPVASAPAEEHVKFTTFINLSKYTENPVVEVQVPVTHASQALVDGREVAISAEGFVQVSLKELPLGESFHTLRLSGDSSSQVQEIPITVTYYPGWEIRRFTDEREEAYAVAFSPDGQTVISSTKEKTLKLWEVASGQKLRTFSGHSDWVTGIAFSPDGQTVISCSDDKTLRLWEVASGQKLRTFSGHSDLVNGVAFSPDGKTVASASKDKTLKLWDVATGKELRTLVGHNSWVIAVAFAPDGKSVVSGSDDKTVRLWDVKTGKLVRVFSGHRDTVFSVAVAPDGKTLASGAHDNTVKLWDIASGREVRTLVGHSDRVNGVAFSPDGERVVSGGKDKTVKVWEVRTGQEIRTFVGHGSTITGVAFSPDGKTVISSSRDKTLRLWWAAVEPQPEGEGTLAVVHAEGN